MGNGATTGLVLTKKEDSKCHATIGERERTLVKNVRGLEHGDTALLLRYVVSIQPDTHRRLLSLLHVSSHVNVVPVSKRCGSLRHGGSPAETLAINPLAISSVSCDALKVLRIELWWPYKRQVALQTPLLREGVRALRQALSAAYRGHPPFAVPVTLQIPTDMYEPLPPLPPDPTGGFLPLLRLHASLALPGYYQGPIADNVRLSAALSVVTPAEVTEACRFVYGMRLRVSGLHRGGRDRGRDGDKGRPAAVMLIPALRALRFNTLFTGLDLSGLGEGGDGESEAAALAELLMYNVTIQEFVACGFSQLRPDQWALVGRALCLNPRPLIHAWDLTGVPLQDAGLQHLLPAMARLFSTCVGPSRLDVSHASLTVTSVAPLLHVLLGRSVLLPVTPNYPRPPPPLLTGLIHLSLAGADLSTADGPLAEALQEVLTRCKMLTSFDLSTTQLPTLVLRHACIGLSESNCPLRCLDVRNNADLLLCPSSAPCAEVASLLACKKKTLLSLSLDGVGVGVGGLGMLLGGLPEPLPDLFLDLRGALLMKTGGGQEESGALDGLVAAFASGRSPGTVWVGQDVRQSLRPLPDVLLTALLYGLGNGPAPPSITALDLSNVWPEPDPPSWFAGQLANALSANSCLQSLTLRSSQTPSSLAPLAPATFLSALGSNSALTHLDVAGIGFGDKGAEALGAALRKNRTLRSLLMDDNHVGLNGYSAIRGALYGNKKIVELPQPQKDVQRLLDDYAQRVRSATSECSAARYQIKQACRSRNYSAKQQALGHLRTAGSSLRSAEKEKGKLLQVLKEIATAVGSNQAAYQALLQQKASAPSAMARKGRNVAKLGTQANRLLKRMALAFRRGTTAGPQGSTKPAAFPTAGPPPRPVGAMSRPRQQPDHADPYYYYTPCYYDPYRFDPCPGAGIWPHTSGGGGTGGGGHGGLGGWDSIMHHMGDPFRTVAEQVEHTVGRAGEWVEEGITRAEDGVNWLVNEAHEVAGGLPTPDVLEQRLESLIGLGPALLQDRDLLNEAQGLATQLGGEVSHALGAVLAEAREFGQDLQSAVTGLGATTSEVFDQMNLHDADGQGAPEGDRDTGDNEGTRDGADGGDDLGDVVEMYGSAGPRDLPDGGHQGGGYCADPVRAGHHVWPDSKRQSKRRLTTVKPSAWDIVGLEDAFRRMWQDALVSSLKADGIFEPLEYKTLARAFTHTEPGREGQQVTLVTQCSTDRLASLEAQARAWGGPVSVAIYISTASRSTLQTQLQAVQQTVTSLSTGPNRASYDVALVFGQEGSGDTEEGAWVSDESRGLYPINALRNVALCQALREPICRKVLLVDVDFVPHPRGMCDRLCGFYEQESSELGQPAGRTSSSQAIGGVEALIVPAFSVDAAFPPKQSMEKSELSALYKEGKAWGFHTRHFPQGHGATDFDRWFNPLSDKKSACYEVAYEPYFEPYIVMDKHQVPLYDERFKGYGMNKIAHLYQVAQLPGAHFRVWEEGFLVSRDHDRSPSWEQTYGKTKEPTRRLYLEALYCRFKEGVNNGVAPRISRATARLHREASGDLVRPCTLASDVTTESQERRAEVVRDPVDRAAKQVDPYTAKLIHPPQTHALKSARQAKIVHIVQHRLLRRLRDMQRTYMSSRADGPIRSESLENIVV